MKKTKGKTKSSVSKESKELKNNAKRRKQTSSHRIEEPAVSRKRPKRAAACTDFKEKLVPLSEKSSVLESKNEQFADEEIIAIHLTHEQEGRPNRRLTDFVVHDANGMPRPLEMIEVDDMFISGLILPLEGSPEQEKEKCIRCEGFGRIEGWSISGYEDGSPVVWLTTDIADYDCLRPASSYKKFYDRFFEKAYTCIEVYKKLSKSSGGNPDITLDELLAGVVRSMTGRKCFSGAASIKDFVISHGEFIYNQLIGLDDTSKKNDQKFADLPVLLALKDKSRKHGNYVLAKAASSCGNLTICPKVGGTESTMLLSNSSSSGAEEDEDAKLARLLQEEEYWQSTKKQKKSKGSASSSNTIYIKINEDEIANDYPLPAFYSHSDEETDEYVAIDSDEHIMVDPDDLPKRMLHNWSLYNSDSRLISLELLPMKPCEDIDVTIFGSGRMTEDDGSGFHLENDPDQSSSGGSGAQDDVGLPIFLSAIKEWMIEFGSSVVFISIRTDMAWYRLGKPSNKYSPWYKPVLKTAKLARSIITLLKEQSRVSRLSFADVIRKISEFKKDDHGYISHDPAAVERYVVVHGQIILQLFAEFPDEKIKKCAFVSAIVRGEVIAVGGAVLVEVDESNELPLIYFVEYMFETSDGSKMFHGRMMQQGHQTVLGNAANEREVFLRNECMNYDLQDVKQAIVVELRKTPWGHRHRKDNANTDRIDRARAEDRKRKGLPLEYYCRSLYWPERGAFFSLTHDTMGLGSGVCHSCKIKEAEMEKDIFKVNSSMTRFVLLGIEYSVNDFVYASPYHFTIERETETFKGGRNVGLKAYVVCQLLEIIVQKEPQRAEARFTQVKVRRFFRPEDVSSEKAYCSDIREIYYSEDMHLLPAEAIEGKCEVRKKNDIPTCSAVAIFDHIFFCEHLYDPSTGSLKQLPANIKMRYSIGTAESDAASRKRKGKCKEGEDEVERERKASQERRLATLDIFAGCGGLSEGLQHAGISSTKWAIEYEEPAGEAFKLNNPTSLVFINNCNVILRAAMEKCGDAYECISTTEAIELAASLDKKVINDLPVPGQVDFINGGPPCQGFSGMNRFSQSTWSKVQCEMILAFLSFVDYFRPKYFLLENVRNFVSFNKGQTFRLTLASLLEMGYQVRFGILEAGAYGVSQSRKRVFIWAASPDEILPEWPEPMHVFAAPELKVMLSENLHYAAVRSTASGAPFRAITVRDTIGDLPAVGNGASKTILEYKNDPISWFQKKIRGETAVLTDHISKEMNELNLIRCQKIPKQPGSDWRDLPDEKIKLSTGQVVDLIPWCLPNTAKRHNQWKGLFGRLDWEGNFPTSITDPQPMGKVGMCFHPEQDRILTVRECARSQGFPDSYKFAGNIQHKHRQIGNAVPPPLAYALGTKLKEAMNKKAK
ncbi:hypothetical protein GH714_024481 [Hevea brasiliensis]|uniref:DNA (cytosine-5)-methyltransferase n=1 Tax=Hevea brasiliensis TaxID=3981 RepID=A0A6A6K7J4_HEVBR|nr:hypothetical protein GH714_024481 [Hevea brasiliensis]